jgi:para-nitrobenzyl esterase
MGIEIYLGLRYAEPVQRFLPSIVATTPWQGRYDATRYGAMALQAAVVEEVYGPQLDAPFSEDCLFLNIHTPQAPALTPRPVIVFIHGGSFTAGSGNFYDGTALALGADSVVVCINYRLGIFAAFDIEWLGTKRDGGGQLWLGDQINALQWVRDNIADYGGDPSLVTIIGESAGAVSVAALCAAPEAESLVHRAMACSTGYLTTDASTDVVGVISKTRRCSRTKAIDYLKSAPADELIALQKRGKQVVPRPVANTPLLPGRMEDLIHARGSKAVPLIAGYATHEGASLELMLRAKIRLPSPILRLISHLIARAVAAHGAKGKANIKPYLRRLKKAAGIRGFGAAFNDLVWTDGFRRGAHEYAEATAYSGAKAYIYVMDIPMRFAGQSIPSSHGIDLALTFNVGDDPEATVPPFADHPNANALARRWVRMLGHFARHGESGDALGDWPVYGAQTRFSMRVSGDGCVVQDDVDRLYREQVWDRVP